MSSSLIRKILVPTDGSNLSMVAAQYAALIAKCADAEVVILHAAEVSLITQFVTYSLQSRGSPTRELRETGEIIVQDARKLFIEADIPAHTKIIQGSAADVIIREAEDGGYDLIAMGSRGAGAGVVRRVLLGLGSVADRVVANATCPVLVVRHSS